MDEQEREKLFQEIRSRISDSELEERRLREEELSAEALRKREMHWSIKLAIFLGIIVAGFVAYLIMARMGLIWGN